MWFILPAKEVMGIRSVSLCMPAGQYEKYRKAWELLREAVGEEAGVEDKKAAEADRLPSTAVERMRTALNFARRRMGVE